MTISELVAELELDPIPAHVTATPANRPGLSLLA